MSLLRSYRRLAAAGTGLLAAAGLALAATPAAHAQDPLTPVSEADPTLSWIRYDEGPSPLSFCKRFPRACELVHQEPVLFPDPDPGPYRFEDLVFPVARLGASALDGSGAVSLVPGLRG